MYTIMRKRKLFPAGSQESRVGCSLKTEYTPVASSIHRHQATNRGSVASSDSLADRVPSGRCERSELADGDVCAGGVLEDIALSSAPIFLRVSAPSRYKSSSWNKVYGLKSIRKQSVNT
jgi:hypothetical protein